MFSEAHDAYQRALDLEPDDQALQKGVEKAAYGENAQIRERKHTFKKLKTGGASSVLVAQQRQQQDGKPASRSGSGGGGGGASGAAAAAAGKKQQLLSFAEDGEDEA